MADRLPMVHLTSVTGSFAAHVLHARLEAEGIDADLRGAVDGPYPFSVGALAEVAVYVPEDQLADARMVLLADEIDAAVEAPATPRKGWRPLDLVVAAVVLLIFVALLLARATGPG